MRVAVVALLILSAIAAVGESKTCLYPTLAVPDNRIVNSPQFEGSFNGYTPTYWYAFYGQALHSYSVEFVPTLDNENTSTSIRFVNAMVWGPSDVSSLQANGCFGPSTLSLTATQGFSPVISHGVYGTGERLTFMEPATGLNIICISNSQAAGPYSYRITDTTMFNPRWSTLSGYDTTWGFTNMSDMTITGTLYVFGLGNHVLAAPTVTIPANEQVFRGSGGSDLNLPRNSYGTAIFEHNGPPGSIIGDAYMVNGTATVVTYTKFESRSTQ
jgi:hypothetical protein